MEYGVDTMSELSDQAPSARPLEGMSEHEIFDLLERAKTDPATALRVALMQKQCDEMIREVAHQVAALFATLDPAPRSGTDPAAGVNVRALEAQSRSRADAGKQRLSVAEEYVIGKLVNIGNSDWDPLDPSTSREADKSAFLALLDFHLPENGATQG
jgi:hypothetical protein